LPLLTKLTRLQIEELLKQNFDVGALHKVFKVKSGWNNTLFKVTTSHGDFFLKVYEESDPIQVMAEHEVLSHLLKIKFPTAGIIKTRNKEGVVVFEEKLVGLFVALNGTPLKTNPLKSVLGFRIVTLVNLLHKTDFSDFIYLQKHDLAEEIEQSTSWYLNDHRLEHFRDQLNKLYGRFSNISFQSLTKGVVHNDLGTDNFLVNGNNIAGLIDFDQVALGSVINDLAIFFARSINLNMYSVNEFTVDAIRFVLDYEKKTELTRDDLKSIVPLIVFQKFLILIKLKQNLRDKSLKADLYNFEEYSKLVENELELLFRNYDKIENEFNRYLS